MTTIKLSSLVKDKTPKISRKLNDYDFVQLLGPSLLIDVKSPAKPTTTLLKKKELILLYFAASFTKNDKRIRPSLIEFYNAAAEDNDLEIIYVSSDGIVEEFEGHYETMPWLAIPSTPGSAAIKQYLAQTLSVRKQPSLIVIDAKTGELVSTTVTDDVIATGGDSKKAKIVIDKWKILERKPLSEAGKSDNLVVRIFMYMVKNPMLIFGIMSAIRILRQKALDYYLSNSNNGAPVMVEDDHTEF